MISAPVCPPGCREGALKRVDWLLSFRFPTDEAYAQTLKALSAANLMKLHGLICARYVADSNCEKHTVGIGDINRAIREVKAEAKRQELEKRSKAPKRRPQPKLESPRKYRGSNAGQTGPDDEAPLPFRPEHSRVDSLRRAAQLLRQSDFDVDDVRHVAELLKIGKETLLSEAFNRLALAMYHNRRLPDFEAVLALSVAERLGELG